MLYYKKMTKDQVIKWWEELDNGNSNSLVAAERIPVEKKNELLHDEAVYSVISSLGYGPEQSKQFKDFIYTITKEFKENRLGGGVFEFTRQYNQWLLHTLVIDDTGRNSDLEDASYILIDQDKLTFVEKVFGHKFLNEVFMSSNEPETGKKGKKNYERGKRYPRNPR